MVGLRVETGMAIAALALHVAFIAYMTSLYFALSKPIASTNIILFPLQLAAQGVFLFGLTGFGLAGIAYMLSRRDALRIVSFILIAQGIIMPLGMLYTSTMAGNINIEYRSSELLFLPTIFLIAGFAPIGLGVHLVKLKPARRIM